MPKTPCIGSADCPNFAVYRGRCEYHKRERERQRNRSRDRTVYNSKRWRRLRRRVLNEQPICDDCDNALATQVDHIIPVEDGGAPYRRSNVHGLCDSCHSRKTTEDIKRRQAAGLAD